MVQAHLNNYSVSYTIHENDFYFNKSTTGARYSQPIYKMMTLKQLLILLLNGVKLLE